MNNQDTWNNYTLTPWNGTPLPQGAYIALRTTQFEIAQHPYSSQTQPLSSFLNTMSWANTAGGTAYDYVTASETNTSSGCLFRITTWPALPYEEFGCPNCQKILLQTANGKYLAPQTSGVMFAACADQADARAFFFDLTRGHQTILYDGGYNYAMRTTIEPAYCNRYNPQTHFESGIITVFMGKPVSSQPILYQIVQGVSNAAVLDVFVATLKTGVRTIDPDTGIIYLMIDGHLRQVPDATTYANLFKDPQSSLLPSSATAFPVGPPLTNGAHLAKAQLTPEAAARVPMPHDPYPFLGNGQVYFIVDGKKHKITSGPAFDSFGFNSAKIQQVAPQLINALPVGPDI